MLTGDSERERIDIAFVRKQVGVPHLSDPDALAAFADGRGIFDVDAHCRKLDAFIAEHKLEAVIDSECLLPCADPQAEKRPVYFGRARWQKRSTTRPDQVA
jgi:hypothetical protein